MTQGARVAPARPSDGQTPGQRLFAKQIERATTGGSVDIDTLAELVTAAYDDADRDRKRTDRSIALMVQELDELNAGLEQTITERTQALTKAEARYRDLIEHAMISVYRSSPAGELLFANLTMARLNGYQSEAELLARGQHLALEWYVEPGRRAAFAAALERDGRVSDFISEVRRHGTGERIWILKRHGSCAMRPGTCCVTRAPSSRRRTAFSRKSAWSTWRYMIRSQGF